MKFRERLRKLPTLNKVTMAAALTVIITLFLEGLRAVITGGSPNADSDFLYFALILLIIGYLSDSPTKED